MKWLLSQCMYWFVCAGFLFGHLSHQRPKQHLQHNSLQKTNTHRSILTQVLDQSWKTTTKLVVGLMDSAHLLDKGHCMYMDNFYTSPDFMRNFIFHSTYAFGTVCPNRKGLPTAVTTAKLKKTEADFRCNGPLLAIKWCDKRAVTVLPQYMLMSMWK